MTVTPWRNPVWPSELELQDDLEPSRWVLPRLLPWGVAHGTPVGSIVPTGFGAYVRLLHPAGTGRADPPVRWSDVSEANGRIYHPLMQWDQIKEADPDVLGLEWLSDPRTGHLESEMCRDLYGLLADWTSTPEVCWVGIWHGFGSLYAPSGGSVAIATFRRTDAASEPPEDPEIATTLASWEEAAAQVRRAPTFHHPARDYLLTRGPCRAVWHLTERPLDITPSLAWPEDHAWCVGSEIDFDSTLIAASRECADALLADDRFETVEVHEEGRLDAGGDLLNPPVD